MTDTTITHHDEIAPLLSLYALDQADPAEARDVERHVARCSTCHASLRRLIDSADALDWAPAQSAMPEHVQQAIMARFDEEHPVVAPAAARSRPARQTRWARVLGLRGTVAIAASVACTIVALFVGRATAPDQRVVSGVADAPNAHSMTQTSRVVSLTTSGALTGSAAEFADVHGAGLIVTKNLPAPSAGYVYRIWGVTKTHEMHPMGVLQTASHGGMGLQPVGSPDRRVVRSIEITLEPSAGSPIDPSGPVVGHADLV